MSATTQPPVSLELSDADYWTAPDKQLFALLDPLSDAEFDGVLIGAPRFVDLARRSTLPLVVIRAGTDAQRAELDIRMLGLIVAVELEHGVLRVAKAFDTSDVEDDDDEEPGEGYSAELETVELRELLEIDWRPSSYAIHFLLRDRLSNRVVVRLGERGYRDDAVERLLAERRAAERQAALLWPVLPLADVQAQAESPALPSELGVELRADRVVVLEPGARCMVRGSFRLSIHGRELVAADDPLVLDSSPVSPKIHAVVGVTLVVVGSKSNDKLVLPLRLPCITSPEQHGDELIATGYFTIDLLALGMSRAAQTHFIYAFTRALACGPVLAALVEPERLR
jgi:hypothetical protein